MRKLILLFILTISMSGFAQLSPFHLSDVHLGESALLEAQHTSYQYVMAHNPDRLLAPFRREAGLPQKAEGYGNWENTGLDGHIGGHYLTALAQIVATTNDSAASARLKYMIDELALCQQANGNGYVGGVPGSAQLWIDIKQGKINAQSFSLNNKWVPLYNIHKLFSGLRDAYLLTNNVKAKEILIGLSDWTIDLVSNLTDEQIQLMLRSEHGGMNEVFADVAEITGNTKYLDLARRFSHNIILEPLLQHQDKLNGMHANTQIPKVIGYERVAEVAHDTAWQHAAEFFWETVVDHRTVSIGGNSVREHFHPANNFTSMIEDREGPETCNTYNMMKLSKQLFLATGQVKYLDYYERAMYNHILSSQNPEHGGLVYFTSMRPRHYRVYSKAETAFWCCVGSGMENHSKYGELIYAHSANDLYVNLYLPSELNWTDKGISLKQETQFPDTENSTLIFDMKKPQTFTLNLRYPNWVKTGALEVKVNGKIQKITAQPSEFVALNRKWKKGDRVEVKLPMYTRAEFLPDGSKWAALVHGPFVLAAQSGTQSLDGLIADDSRMGHIASGKLLPLNEAPVLVTSADDIDAMVEPTKTPFVFEMRHGVYPETEAPIVLKPFYQIHNSRYQIYWMMTTPAEIEKGKKEAAEKEAALLALEAQTIDYVSPGEQQPESDHNFRSDRSESGVYQDRHWRHAQGWFSYDLKQPETASTTLRITYSGSDSNRTFTIYANDITVAQVMLSGKSGAGFVDVDYPITAEMIQKSVNGKLVVKFEAAPNSIAGGVFGVRLMKK